jgi:hypothetical protein
MADLLSTTELTAKFKAGQSPLGHHWELFDADEQPIGRTRREYGGGALKRGLWRTVTATGMDSGNDIRAEVLDAGGDVVAHLFSRNEKGDRRVEVSAPDGSPVGVADRDPETGFRFLDAGGTPVATVAIPDPKEAPWQLLDAGGQPLGVLDRVKAQRVAGPSISDYVVGFNTFTDNARDFQNTMHLGFAFSNTYSVSLPELPAPGALRTLAVLSPVILGYAY